MKKKTVSMILVCAMLLSVLCLGGCGSEDKPDASSASDSIVGEENAGNPEGTASSEAADQLAAIQEKGEMVFAMEGAWAPWTYHDDSGELVGYDTDVAKLIAEKLGVKATFVEGEWDSLFVGMDSGRFDAVINGVEVTEERAEKYDFTDPYVYIHTALIVASDNEEIKSFEDLKGKKTANSLNSTYMLLAQDYGATVSAVDTLDETMQMVLSGRVDATLNSVDSFSTYMSAQPDAALKVVALTEEASQVAIPLRKGSETESLRAAINQALSELRESGELAALSEKYFGSDLTNAD